MHLSEAFTVSSGQQVSTQPTADYRPLAEPVNLLQLSDFNDDGQPYQPFRTQLTSLPPAAEKHLLEAGQLLLTAKGARLFTTYVRPDWLPALASTSFFVLTPQVPHLLPEFLALVLNLPDAREALRSLFATTTIPTLSRRSLLALALPLPNPLPPRPVQQRAVELLHLWHQEKSLLLRYLPLREQRVHSQLQQLVAR
ncbi:hypothetical protein A0257_22195 [Hymenobacter psoromatis]|nr:hypothetical protein A0257_22195 [Hymenobacter psoromatis]